MYSGVRRMPPVREIDLSDGIRIVTTGGLPNVNQSGAQIAVMPGNLTQKEQRLNKWLQRQYEVRIALADLEPDDRALLDPPELLSHERIEKIGGIDYWIGTLMYVQAHIFSLDPLKLTLSCSNSPITEDDWWL